MARPARENHIKAVLLLIIAGAAVGATVGLSFHFWYYPVFFEQREPRRFFWLSAMFTAESMQLLQDHPERIDMVSPTWYALQANGSIFCQRSTENDTLQEMLDIIALCKANNITVHPLVSASNETVMRNLLERADHQQAFFSSLAANFEQFDFDGINIDLEGIPDDLRDEFTGFFGALSESINGTRTLSIDVPAKTSDTRTGWDGWCNYQAIGEIADMVMIMTYDAHGGWTGPGEIAPTSWVRDVLAYAVRAMPPAKIHAGIPFYGYDWSDAPGWQNVGFGHGFFTSRQATFGGQTNRTGDGKEVRYEYIDGGGYHHVAYYCDAETTRAKEAFLAGYPIGGYCYWHLSCGDPAYFDL